nr:hypothetical protein [uncultured Marinifilum sp.]
MEKLQGGQVEDCYDFMQVQKWLLDNGHYAQFQAITEAFMEQYCG